MGNLQVIGNPRLTDISALEAFLGCGNVTSPLTTIGAVEVIPTVNPDPQSIVSCLLGTIDQVRRSLLIDSLKLEVVNSRRLLCIAKYCRIFSLCKDSWSE